MTAFCPQDYLPVIVPMMFMVFFPVVWTASLGLVSAMTGWRRLAAVFPGGDPPLDGTRWRFRTAGFRNMSHYSGCLTFTATLEGLHLVPFILFRPFHPPLFIPWSAMTPTVERIWSFAPPSVRITFADPEPGQAPFSSLHALTHSLDHPTPAGSAGGLFIRLTLPFARVVFAQAAATGSAEGARLLAALDQEPSR